MSIDRDGGVLTNSSIDELAGTDGDGTGISPTKTKNTSNKTGMTLAEIAELYGCTRERIRQIEAEALRKLRWRMRALGVDPKNLLPDDSITDKDY